MNENINKYIDTAIEMYNAGFSSKAAQKRCNDKLNQAYNKVRLILNDQLLNKMDMYRTTELENVYYALPFDLHQWRNKHEVMLKDVGVNETEIFNTIQNLKEMRDTVKASPIVPPAKNKAKEKHEKVIKSLKELMEKREGQYQHGIKMVEYFGTLNVSVNAHWVINQHGTKFIRHFFYLNGELTPLAVIIAIAEATK